jgi:Leucine-rich repeat (LRR) protein
MAVGTNIKSAVLLGILALGGTYMYWQPNRLIATQLDSEIAVPSQRKLSTIYVLLPFSEEEIEVKQVETNSPVALAQAWQTSDPGFPSYSEARNEQRLALATFYYATGGSFWTNNTGWLSYDIAECEWFSRSPSDQVCDGDGNYLRLHLDNNNLLGTLPIGISALSNLQSLDLNFNYLLNSIPSSLQTLTTLDYINLAFNSFTGSIPVGLLVPLINLRQLAVNNNLLNGTIPSEVGNLQR